MDTRVTEGTPATLQPPTDAQQLAMYGETEAPGTKAPSSVGKVPAKKAPTGAAATNVNASAEVKQNLGIALRQLSGGKVQSLEQFKTYKGADRTGIEKKLNDEISRVSKGEVKTWQALEQAAERTGAPGKRGYNPFAAAIYATTGAIVTYGLLNASGLEWREIWPKLPGSFTRALITSSIAQIPTGIKNPVLEFSYKAGVGALLTLTTNAVAGKIHPDAALSKPMNRGMVLSAITTSGAVVGLKELQKRGYLGGTPPDDPKDWGQFFHKYGPLGLTTGLSLVPGVVGGSYLHNLAKKAPMGRNQILALALQTVVLPTVQTLLSNAIVNPPKNAALDTSKFPPGTVDMLKHAAEVFSQAGLQVLSDKIYAVISMFGKPLPAAGTAAAQWSLKASAGMVAWVTSLTEVADVLGTSTSLIGRNTKDIHQARQALAEIDKLLRHPFTYLSNPNPALSPYEAINPRDERIEGLKLAREEIYKQHPELRPRNATPGR